MKTIIAITTAVVLLFLVILGIQVNNLVEYTRLTTSDVYTHNAITLACVTQTILCLATALTIYFIISYTYNRYKIEQAKKDISKRFKKILEKHLQPNPKQPKSELDLKDEQVASKTQFVHKDEQVEMDTAKSIVASIKKLYQLFTIEYTNPFPEVTFDINIFESKYSFIEKLTYLPTPIVYLLCIKYNDRIRFGDIPVDDTLVSFVKTFKHWETYAHDANSTLRNTTSEQDYDIYCSRYKELVEFMNELGNLEKRIDLKKME